MSESEHIQVTVAFKTPAAPVYARYRMARSEAERLAKDFEQHAQNAITGGVYRGFDATNPSQARVIALVFRDVLYIG